MAEGGNMSGMGWMQAANAAFDAYNIREQGKIAKTRREREAIYQQFNQWAADRTAGLVVAASQREAHEELRQADLVASRALAVAAAGGGGVSDPTMVNILARQRGEGVYRANVALYEGEERARSIRIQGAGADDFDTSRSIMAGANVAAAGRLAKGGMSLYAKYGQNGPDAAPASGGAPGSMGGTLDWNSTGDFYGSPETG